MTSQAFTRRAFLFVSLALQPLLPAFSQSCVPVPSGVIAWYSFDETSGAIAQDTTGQHPGAYFGQPAPSPGEVDGSLLFNGSTDFVAAPDSDAFAFGQTDFSIELWANFDWAGGGTIAHPGDILIGNDEGPGEMAKWFFSLGGGALSLHLNSPSLGPQFFPRAPFSPTPGRWYHLAVTRAGDLYNIWIDGQSAASAINHSIVPNPDAPLTLGQAESLGYLHGRLDEVTLYNRALTANEIAAIAAAGQAGKCKAAQAQPVRVFPNVGGNIGTVTMRIVGSDLSSDTRVSLVGIPPAGDKALGPGLVPTEIVGQIVGVAPNLGEVTAVFRLDREELGLRDLVIERPNAPTETLRQAFTIEAGRASLPWVEIVGPGAARLHTPTSIQVLYGNRGNVDARLVPLWIEAPAGATLVPEFSLASTQVPGTSEAEAGLVPVVFPGAQATRLPLLLPTIPPGSTAALSITTTLEGRGINSFRAWLGGSLDPDCDAPPCFEPPFPSAWPPGSPPPPPPPPTAQEGDCIVENIAECWLSIAQLLNDVTLGTCVEELRAFVRGGAISATRYSGSPLKLGGSIVAVSLGAIRGAAACSELVPDIGPLVALFQIFMDGHDIYEDCRCEFQPRSVASLNIGGVESLDPNDLTGAAGFGPLHYLSTAVPLAYLGTFTNIETATAPALQVLVTDSLDAKTMDLRTLALGPITFGHRTVIPPLGVHAFATTVDLRPDQNLFVRIDAGLDPNTAVVSWRFTSIDPATGLAPLDPLAGFLPPNVHPPEGEGSISFTVMPKPGNPTGTPVLNRATIVFDTNDPLVTPFWLNTLDGSAPLSHISPASLPFLSSRKPFPTPLRWSATDVGSGVKDYDVYVSEDGGPYQALLLHTTATSSVFTPAQGKAYYFYSVGRDRTDNQGAVPPAPQQ